MSSLGGRRRERGKTLLSPGSGPRFIREPAIDRLSEDRLAGVLSLLRSAQPAGPEFAESEFAESEFAESEVSDSEVAESEFAWPEFAESTEVISQPEDSVPARAAREDSLPAAAVPEVLVPEVLVPEDSVPAAAVPEDSVPAAAVPEDSVPAAAVPAVAKAGRHRRPAQMGRASKKVPLGLRVVGLVVRRAAAIGLVTLVAITVGLGVLKAWG